jgi:hypothetical protein
MSGITIPGGENFPGRGWQGAPAGPVPALDILGGRP